ncbi:hypothetical protein MMC19_006865 [Ptychographa xylographoides]|nr:hypothetical protein [Ptychographa xylographoides]
MPSASPIVKSPGVKPVLPTLKTPCSAGPVLPSELPRSPLPIWHDLIKQEDNDLRTPITPPTAYTDFLKALSPAISPSMLSPSTASSINTCFSDKSGKLTPMSIPSSAGSFSSCNCDARKNSAASAPLVPPSPFVKPSLSRAPSARTPTSLRRLRIPQSPSAYSPATDSPRSAVMRSPFSPTEWILDGKTRYYSAPRSAGTHRPVSVKQVVTRTVTYTRTPLEPAPKGKRRKVE